MSAWVTLAELKNDQYLDTQALARDDQALQRTLNAAMAWVQRHRPDLNYFGVTTVPEDVRLGTLRLAARWSMQSTADLGELGEQGSRRIWRLDADIYSMLGVRP